MGRQNQSGNIVNNTITIPKLADQVIVRSEQDIDLLMVKLARKLKLAQLNRV